MAKDPAFLFYPGDYLRDTQCLSEKTQVAYDRIMCEHMRNISEHMINISISPDKLNFFTKRLNDDEKSELLSVLTKTSNGFQIEWVAESISKRKSYSNSRADNRRSKDTKDILTYEHHMENANENEDENTQADELPEKNKTNSPINIPFSDFWNLYDRKTGDKERAQRLWNKLKDQERDAIMAHVPLFKIAQPEKQYRPHPATYLHQQRWENEIVTDGVAAPPPSNSKFTNDW